MMLMQSTEGHMHMQGSSEVLFRKVKFWDGGGQDAPPVFHVDGVNYLYVKVRPTNLNAGNSNASSMACTHRITQAGQ